MPFGSDWWRLWVGNPREWQIARAARRKRVPRGKGAALAISPGNGKFDLIAETLAQDFCAS